MRKMKRQPTHPGKIIKADYLIPLSITIEDMSAILGPLGQVFQDKIKRYVFQRSHNTIFVRCANSGEKTCIAMS